MEKKDLGEVKETKRIRNGVEQVIRLFNKKQRQIIKDAVKNRPDEMTIEDVLNLYEVSPAVYYSWVRNDKEERKDGSDLLPNPLADSFRSRSIFSSDDQLREFYKAKSREIQEFIQKKFQDWLEQVLKDQISSKITPENISEVAIACSVTVEDIENYLKGGKVNLNYFSIETLRRYLGV